MAYDAAMYENPEGKTKTTKSADEREQPEKIPDEAKIIRAEDKAHGIRNEHNGRLRTFQMEWRNIWLPCKSEHWRVNKEGMQRAGKKRDD